MNETKGAMFIAAGNKQRCTIGKRTYAADGSPLVYFYEGCESWLRIGSYVAFGPQVKIIVGGEHHTEWVSTYPFANVIDGLQLPTCITSKGDIVIGSDVWIGGYVTILSGVTIGHGAVIGAGTIVANDVEPYSIVIGNPMQELRWRFTDAQRKKLLQIRWWEWDEDKVERALPYLMDDNIERFIQFVESRNGGDGHAV